ncbi:atypical/ABC1/ABC1-B protein kinase, partial [Aphelenchoides avenae]
MLGRLPRRILKVASGGVLLGIGGASLYFFHQNDYSLSNIGVIRFARVGVAATETIMDYKWSLMGLASDSEKYKERLKQCHLRGAHRLLDLAKANGGVFIKVGQHIASLEYLLPEEYTSTMSVLHSKAPESDLDELKQVFRSSVHKELDDVFLDFNPKPHGVASLAQVHEARLRENGEKVAVKIQHPKVKSRSVVDIATMELFFRIADAVFPDFKLMWLVEETRKNLPKELDFMHEARNADRVRRMFSHLSFLNVPKVYYDYTSELVLTMEFCEGGQINDLAYFERNKLDKHSICRMIGRLYSEMIFVNGYIHCDPHPGNVLVHKDPSSGKVELVLLDHGLYQTLQDDFRVDYCHFWLALLKPDKDEIHRICTKFGIGEFYGLFSCIVTARSWQSVTQGIQNTKVEHEEQQEIKAYAASLIPQISQVLDRMPREMLLILKTNDLIRAIEHRLGTQNRSDSFLE